MQKKSLVHKIFAVVSLFVILSMVLWTVAVPFMD